MDTRIVDVIAPEIHSHIAISSTYSYAAKILTLWQCQNYIFDVSAVNKLIADKDESIANFALIRYTLFDTAPLEAEVKQLQSEMSVVAEMIQDCIDENSRIALDQTEYQERYDELACWFDTDKTLYEETAQTLSDKKARGEMMESFNTELGKQSGG